MNHRLLTDLVNKVNDDRCRAVDRATDLLDNPEEIRAFLFAIIASDIAALIDALAYQDKLHPLFSKLSRPYQVMGVMGILANLVQEGRHPPANKQALDLVSAAVKELHTAVKMERLKQ